VIVCSAVVGGIGTFLTVQAQLTSWVQTQVNSQIDARIAKGELITNGSIIVLQNFGTDKQYLEEGKDLPNEPNETDKKSVWTGPADTNRNKTQIWYVQHFVPKPQ
jgi:hypothetical protein